MSSANNSSSDERTELGIQHAQPEDMDIDISVQVSLVHSQIQSPDKKVDSNAMPSFSDAGVMVEVAAVLDGMLDAVEKAMNEQDAVAAPITNNSVKAEAAALSSPITGNELESEAMNKLTEGIKQRIMEYIGRMEKVNSLGCNNAHCSSWIPSFIKIVCRPDPLDSVSKSDVVVWMKNCPEIFTPQVVASLRELFNRLRRLLAQRKAVDVRLREQMQMNQLEKESLDSKEHQQ